VIAVTLKRLTGVTEGSVGILLTTTYSGSSFSNGFITINKVVSGSVADHDGRLIQGDRVFFIQSKSTENMNVKEARTTLKAERATVDLIVGRRKIENFGALTLSSSNFTSSSSLLANSDEIFSSDPALEQYSEKPITVVLQKSELGVGFTIHGGRESEFGDRPIVVKKVFTAGEAAKSGKISIGDEVRSINGENFSRCTRLQAFRILKNCPDGSVELVIYKRIGGN